MDCGATQCYHACALHLNSTQRSLVQFPVVSVCPAKESRSGERQAKAAVVDLWSATIQRIASLSKGVKVWGKASQSCCGGPVVSHHPTDSLTAGWLGGLGPAKESRSGARQAKVQVEGIAYSFCGLWISSVLACLCVTSQLNGPWFDSWWSLCLMGPEKKSTTESFGSPLDGGRPQVHHGKLWLSVGWWLTTGPPWKALALRWMVADHRSTTESFGSPLDGG